MGGKTGGTTALPYGGGSVQSGTNTSAPSAAALASYQNVLGQLGSLPSYTNYGGELVAGVNPEQYQGIGSINTAANYAQPYIQQAAGLATQAAQPIGAQQINQYLNPYTQQVVNATEAQFQNQNAQQQSALQGNAAAQGAIGGDRVGVAQANLAGQQSLAQSPVIANLYSQGYGQALQEANTQQQAMAQGAYSLGNLGVSGQNAALQGAGAQLGAGGLEQQTQQALDQALIAQYLSPYSQLGQVAGIAGGIGSLMGGTNTGTQTGMQQGYQSQLAPNQTAQYLGAGIAGLGLFAKDGGRISGFADGGSPYSLPSAASYYNVIPQTQMQRGSTMPQPISFAPMQPPSQSAQQQQAQSDPLKQAQAITSGFKGAQGLGTKISDYMSTPTSQELEAQAEAGGESSGGRVRGFADGGADDSDIYFNPSSLSGVGTGSGSFINTGEGPVPADLQTPTDSIAPGSAQLRSGVENVRGGEAAPVGLVANPLASTRGSFIDETNDPATRARLMRLTEAEVGGQGPAAARAFQESVFNRAAARGQTLNEAMNDRGYYPKVSLRGRSPSDSVMYGSTLGDVLSGSNQSNYATGNASGTVGFAGGPQTYNPGTGERFGREGSDLSWTNTMAYAQGQAGVEPDKYSDAPDIIRNGPRGGVSIGSDVTAYTPTADDTVLLDTGDKTAAKKKGFGLANVFGASDETKQALLAAGFGMMGSGSHYLGQAIGQGGLKGVAAYTAAKQFAETREDKQKALDLQVKRLNQQADFHRDQMTHQEDVLKETKEQHEFERGLPKTIIDPLLGQRSITRDKNGQWIYTDTQEPVMQGPVSQGTGQKPAGPADSSRPFDGVPATSATAAKAQEAGLHSQAYLDAVPQQVRNNIEAVGNYQAPLSVFSKMGRAGLSQDKALALVRQFNPDYNPNWYTLQSTALKNFYASTAPNSPVVQARGYNTAVGHAGDLGDAFQELYKVDPAGFTGMLDAARKSNTPLISYMAAQAEQHMARGTATGTPWAKIAAIAPLYAAETAKFYSGSAGSETERQQIQAPFNPNLSYPEVMTALKTQMHMFKSKTDPLEQEFRDVMDAPGLKEYGTSKHHKEWVATKEHAAQALQHIDQLAGTTAAPSGPTPKEGEIRQFKQGPGIYRGGRWQPYNQQGT